MREGHEDAEGGSELHVWYLGVGYLIGWVFEGVGETPEGADQIQCESNSPQDNNCLPFKSFKIIKNHWKSLKSFENIENHWTSLKKSRKYGVSKLWVNYE